MARQIARIEVARNEYIEAQWDGNVWVAPSCGAQFGRAAQALEVEYAKMLRMEGKYDKADALTADDIVEMGIEYV